MKNKNEAKDDSYDSDWGDGDDALGSNLKPENLPGYKPPV
jgi:hypothetical protein